MVPAGTSAIYDRSTKTVLCMACARSEAPVSQHSTGAVEESEPPIGDDVPHPGEPEVVSSSAGTSAQREYERRKAKREVRIRTAHPKVGGLFLAISDEPQSTTAWAIGARGEELLGRQLDGLTGQGVRVLHDRRIPRTKANIDHVAVATSGVFVIDAKRYKGRPQLRVEGGLFRPRVAKLMVGTRDQTKLVDGVRKQVDLVQGALDVVGLAGIPVRGLLCFVEADWPLVGGSFVIDDVDVLWPKKVAEHLTEPGGLDDAMTERVHRVLAAAFPAARSG